MALPTNTACQFVCAIMQWLITATSISQRTDLACTRYVVISLLRKTVCKRTFWSRKTHAQVRTTLDNEDETDNLNRRKTNVCVPGTCFGVRILNSSGGFQYSGVPVCATLYTGIVQGTGSIDNNWVTTTTIKMALTIEILVAPRDFTGIIEGGGTGVIGSLARCTLGVEESNLFTAFTI